jgi:hypothetical protein
MPSKGSGSGLSLTFILGYQPPIIYHWAPLFAAAVRQVRRQIRSERKVFKGHEDAERPYI